MNEVTPKQFLKALSLLCANTRQSIEANQIRALMALRSLPDGGGLSVGEVGDAVGISHVSASRMARVMGPAGLKGTKEKGWGMVELYYDHERPRATMVRLSREGKRTIDDFLELLSS